MKNLDDITVDDVLSVYSGINGRCCCGCSGKYTYNPDYQNLAGEHRGYPVDIEECSKKTVQRILNKVKRNPSLIDYFESEFVSIVVGKRVTERFRTRKGNYRNLEHPGRLYVVYFKPSDKEIEETRLRRIENRLDNERKDREKIQGAGI